MVTDRITITARVENNYATGDIYTHDLTVEVPAPTTGEDLGDWALDHLTPFTGEGPAFAGVEAIYGVTVTACDQRPDLVGLTASGQG